MGVLHKTWVCCIRRAFLAIPFILSRNLIIFGTSAGVANTKITDAVNELDGGLTKAVKEQSTFNEDIKNKITAYSNKALAAKRSVATGRLHTLYLGLQSLQEELAKTVAKLESEQKAGKLFLEAAADKALGGLKDDLIKGQEEDEKLMKEAQDALFSSKEDMAAALLLNRWPEVILCRLSRPIVRNRPPTFHGLDDATMSCNVSSRHSDVVFRGMNFSRNA